MSICSHHLYHRVPKHVFSSYYKVLCILYEQMIGLVSLFVLYKRRIRVCFYESFVLDTMDERLRKSLGIEEEHLFVL